MAMMEKQKVKQNKNRWRDQEQESGEDEPFLPDSVPDAPTLEDFVVDTTNVSIDLEHANSIENEILDAVREDDIKMFQNPTELPKNFGQLSLNDTVDSDTFSCDLSADMPDCESTCLQEREQSSHSLITVDNGADTELQEIISNNVIHGTHKFEADTKLESPCRIPQIKTLDQPKNFPNFSKSGVLESTTKATASFPTAPVMESNVKLNPMIIEEKAPTYKRNRSYSNIEEKFKPTELFKPFTEYQLASLYSNRELEINTEFVSEFVESHLQGNKQHHRLYELLVSYLRARNRLIVNSLELENLKKESKEHQRHLWTIETSTISESGECQDGNPVSASHEYKVSHFNKQSLSNMTITLTGIKELVNEVHSLNTYASEVLRLQIDHYIQNVSYSCPEFARSTSSTPIALMLGEPPPHLIPHISELRTCITLLFTFQRRVVKDTQFVSDTRDWLSKLVAVLLRIASWRDHLFLLNHVLRCPAGVGLWAASFVQAPPPPQVYGSNAQFESSPFASPHLDHMVAALATILLPVREREHFLEQIQTSLRDCMSKDGENDSLWVLVDSDGEEDEDISKACWTVLKENDLVALLNQIPIDSLFRHILLVERRDERDIYDVGRINENHILRLFAFSTVFVRLLRQGLKTYETPRYRQFAKRLGRLIRHTVQYASDQWESFRNSNVWVDPAMLQRLQVEYDAFFLRATKCIFSSQRLGAWQFLAVIPYSVVSLSTLWRLFYILHEDYQDNEIDSVNMMAPNIDWESKLMDPQLRLQFEEKLTTMPDAESYYLLTTFANMAMARGEPDNTFIRVATLDLFQVGFLSTATQETCSKSARILLANITSKHPGLLSDILSKLKDNFLQAGKLSLYLFRELPLRMWLPTETDMATLSQWLLQCSPTSTESHLARLILSSLNWGCTNQLMLPYSLHIWAAVLAVEAVLKWLPENQGTSITDSVKQVSNLASLMGRPQSGEQVLGTWAWELLLRLRLHRLDQPLPAVWTAMANPRAAFANVPELESAPDLEAVQRGVADRQPIACFVAVLLTSWGHSVPQICHQGFHQLQLLLCHHKHSAVLSALQHLIPLFLDSEETLVKSDRFVSILITLLTADRTYVKMAKNLIAPEFPGPILKQFGNMIQYQLENYRTFSLVSPRPFVRLWILCLAQVPDWPKELSVSYLLDIILRCAFFHPDAREAATFILQKLHQSLAGLRQGGTLSSLISWVASGTSQVATLMPRPSCPECPWYAYCVLDLEEELLEERTGLWRELLKEMAANVGKANVDYALKRATHTLKIATPPSSSLSIYRWAQQALDTPMDHPLAPLLWQKFFILFLARVPSVSGVPDRGGVGDKFFEGMVNLSFHKKLKKRLQDSAEYFRSRSEDVIDPGQAEEVRDDQDIQDAASEKKEWYSACSKLMRTFCLWLEEPRLHEPSLFLPALPPQYNSAKLAVILQGDRSPWLEYLDYASIRSNQQTSSWDWQVLNFRTQDPDVKLSISSPEESVNPSDRILKRLQSYDSPVPPPPLMPSKTVIPSIDTEMLYNRGAMLNGVKQSIKTLLEYAQIYSLRVAEHTALDCNFLELVPSLYRDVEMEVLLYAACVSEPQIPKKGAILNCAGPAAIRLKVCEARVNEGIEHMIQENRSEYETILSRAVQPPPQKVCISSVFIEHVIALLESEYTLNKNRGNMEISLKIQDVGVTLFYHMISSYNEDVSLYPPTKQLLTSCLENLGQVFISGDESQCSRLLTSIIQQPHLGGMLGPHFTPAVASTPTFLHMYQTVVNIVSQQPSDLCFVLLSKFDVHQWLVTRRPRLSERSQFIDLVGKALTEGGLNPEEDKLIVHETFRRHLRLMLLYDFPEHYGEVLNLVLRDSESQSLSIDTWFDILNALIAGGETHHRRLKPGQNLGKVKEEIRKYATEQSLLTHEELRDTASLLSCHFMKERLQYGLYGLYPKYRVYIEPLTAYLGMVGHGLVVSTLQHDRGTLSDKLCEQLWPSLNDMFSPWISPYWTRNLKEPTAAWIQQLTDDRSVLLPWITTDGAHAQRMVFMFTECVRFILDTLPACSNILGFLWQFYVTNFAYSTLKDYILNVVHGSFLTLPWDRFWPTLDDLELMLKVVDQYLPDCHSFLGSVFIEVPWWNWVGHVLTAYPGPISVRTHVCLLHLLTKLPSEPNVRLSPKITALLVEAQKFAWHLVDASAYDPVVNWYVMSCDPKVILALDDEESNPIDTAVLSLVQVVAAFVPTCTHVHPSTLKKRQMFVRACVKLALNCASRYKQLLVKKEMAFQNVFLKMLDDIESVTIASTPPAQQVGEAGLLLTELMVAVNQSSGNALAQIAVSCCVRWLQRRDAASIVLQAFLRVLGTTVSSSDHLGALLEAALQAFFKQSVSQNGVPNWQQAVSILQPCVPRQPPLEDALLNGGHVLSLHALLLKRLPLCRDIREEATVFQNLTEWLGCIKPSDSVEPKLPLLWGEILLLAHRQCEFGEDLPFVLKNLRKFCQYLLAMAEDRSWGFLGAIGLRKNSSVSIRGRLLSRAIAVYILAQIPDSEQDFIRTSPNAPGAISSSTVRPEGGGPCASSEALKALTGLEALATSKTYQELKPCVELAVKHIVDPNNSLHSARHVLGLLATMLYPQPYLLSLRT